MKAVEAYTPAQVRACGRMIKATLAKGGQIEDILGQAAFAEANGKNPVLWKSRFILEVPKDVPLTRAEIFGAYGYGLLRNWMKIYKGLVKFDVRADEIRGYLRDERKKDLASTRFGIRGK